jgi:hypothetical protein
MKTPQLLVKVLVPFGALLAVSGCSTLGGSQSSGQALNTQGPTVLNARTNPSTIELNKSWQPTSQAEVLAEVKDFNSDIKDVKLRFDRAPIEIPMQHVSGTTWRAELSPDQLKTLAVAGQTMRYDANIIVTNADGQVAMSPSPVQVAVSAPAVDQKTG